MRSHSLRITQAIIFFLLAEADGFTSFHSLEMMALGGFWKGRQIDCEPASGKTAYPIRTAPEPSPK